MMRNRLPERDKIILTGYKKAAASAAARLALIGPLSRASIYHSIKRDACHV
jgi:hypothetical protein